MEKTGLIRGYFGMVERMQKFDDFDKQFNEGVKMGFAFKANTIEELAKKPVCARYAIKGSLRMYSTTGGAKVDTNFQPTDKNGYPIPGLYAIGQDAGGLYSDSYDIHIAEGTISSYKKGAILVNEDDYLEKIIILKSGVLSNAIMHHELNKSFMMCGIRIPGHISGYTTFILREPAPVRITALSNVEVSSVTFEQMDAFLEQDSKLKNEFVRL